MRRVHEDGAWASPAVDAALERSLLDARDRAFAANLAFSTLRWEGTLDWLLAQVLDRDLADVEPALLDVLRVAAWQIRFGRVADRAAVDTAVELARRRVGARTAGFVNGVLRSLVRAPPGLPAGDGDAAVGLRVGMPAWAVAHARERFGDRALAVLEAGNEPPGLTLRADVDRLPLIEELRASGWDATAGRHPRAIRVAGGVAGRMDAVVEGRATVQDEASMRVVDVVHAVVSVAGTAGDPVLDVCAGPGGKTTGLAQAGLRVVAADAHPVRARLVAELAARPSSAGLGGVVAADATRPAFRDGAAAAVLVDAPCTGLGVVRRRPELRWRRTADDPARLAALQLQLLAASAPLVHPGGALVYSVCTWPDVETRGVVERFLADNPTWWADTGAVGVRLDGDPGMQLSPDLDDTDAMYVAVLRRPS